MPQYKVSVKWGKEKFKDVDCNTDEAPVEFKATLFSLSGVQPDRQKVMMKGITLKDDSWGTLKLKDGVTFLMMGSADALPEAPVERPKFMEDMTEAQLNTALDLPAGLTNLGNTCYMNATLQCLRAVPELKEALERYKGSMTMGEAVIPAQGITAGMRDLFKTMEASGEPIPPFIFLQRMHTAFPQFAEKSEQGGGFAQQDANECWTEMVRCLQQKLPGSPEEQQGDGASSKGFIDQYMKGEFAVSMKCSEAEEEEPVQTSETFYQLSCFINQEVKYMHTGLKNRLAENITKNSPSLGRDAVYVKSSKISRLPAYLSIQFVRFYFKEKEAVNAKILKDVKFPMTLDVFDLCSEDLQQKLKPMRDRFKEEEDRLVEIADKAKQEGVKVEDIRGETKSLPYSFPDEKGSNNSGYYELTAVLTHRGRTSSSGHYVAWVRRKEDEWIMFDDDNVNGVTTEDILKLSGGGDWHCAYVLLYAPKVLQVPINPPKIETKPTEAATETTAKMDTS
ncbi:unnamed protein product [Owenia fusiformis]|uniref:Ubiquitin carboxyl-terminal hydrolase n=1 Tax=Owenia fusiformis TaxID=6347 RepID=A0A8J1UXF1_OWEFU|nr:unnamed protein product [Owenia fusiformis]